jgi:hypothetical protein
MSDTTAQHNASMGAFSPTANRDRAIAQLLTPGEPAWLVEDRYEAPTESWTIGIVRRGPEATWMRQRFRYDSAVDVLFFLGERPMRDEEAAAAQSSGRQLSQ